MVNLSTKYLGLELHNPLVVASCGLTATVDGVKKAADAGAGAVVLKSLFEEQIEAEVDEVARQSWLPGHPEAFDYVRGMGFALGPTGYLELIREAKDTVSIPVIASLNCISPKWWTNYARKLEDAGADALELNISIMPSDPERTSKDIERVYFDILESVKGKLKIPIAVKIGLYFTSMGHMATELSVRGAAGLVLFNRFYKLDMDIEKLELTSGYSFSTPEEMGRSLRWIALLAGRVDADMAASTGIHDAAGVIKQLLAGATVTELCSTLYRNGMKQIGLILKDLEAWMAKHNFDSIADFRGKLSQEESEYPELYERLQYIKALTGIE